MFRTRPSGAATERQVSDIDIDSIRRRTHCCHATTLIVSHSELVTPASSRLGAALRYQKMCCFTEPPQSALCGVTIETKIFNYGRIVGWSHDVRKCCGPL